MQQTVAVDARQLTDSGEWLVSPAGQRALAMAAALPDSLAGLSALREAGLAPEHASAAMTQAALRREAAAKYGLTGAWLLTRDGLEQATRPEVAAQRAGWLRQAGVECVIDATAGLGFDAHAFVEAGLSVIAIERDPGTAALLAHNVPGARVIVGDAVDIVPDIDLASAAVFVDPARRDHRRSADGSRAHPERDPERWSPAWSWVQALAATARVCAKVAPGFAVPPGWQATWTSVDRTVVDCFVASWALSDSPARAVVLSRAAGTPALVLEADPTGNLGVADRIGEFVHEPDPAVLRAGALGAIDGSLLRLDPEGTWLTSDAPSPSPALRSYQVVCELGGDRKGKRRELGARGITRAVVKTADVPASPASVLRELGIAEGPGAVVIACRVRGSSVLLLAEPAGVPG